MGWADGMGRFSGMGRMGWAGGMGRMGWAGGMGRMGCSDRGHVRRELPHGHIRV